MNDMFVLALKTGMRRGEIVALGEGRASISKCGEWIYLPPDSHQDQQGSLMCRSTMQMLMTVLCASLRDLASPVHQEDVRAPLDALKTRVCT